MVQSLAKTVRLPTKKERNVGSLFGAYITNIRIRSSQIEKRWLLRTSCSAKKGRLYWAEQLTS